MPKWLYALIVLGMMTIGVAMILRFGYEPAPQMVMKPSFFNGPEDLGRVVYRRFYAPIEQTKLLVFGVPAKPDWHRGVVQGLLKAAADEGKPFERIVADPQMPVLDLNGLPLAEISVVPMNTDTQSEFREAIAMARKSGKRTLVYVPGFFSTHLLPMNPMERYEKASGEHLFSITSAPLSLQPSEEFNVDPPCVGSERDANGTSKLGCAIMSASRGFYRKKIKADRYVAIMNSPRPDDYLLMIAAPGQGVQ